MYIIPSQDCRGMQSSVYLIGAFSRRNYKLCASIHAQVSVLIILSVYVAKLRRVLCKILFYLNLDLHIQCLRTEDQYCRI